MRTLLGVFHSLERARSARDAFTNAGYEVELIDSSSPTERVSEQATHAGGEGDNAGTAAGATFGALAGGGIGAVPGAAIGRAVAGWLSSHRAAEYQEDIANGGGLVVIHAEELVPAANAESLLYQLGADHVESGEHPLPS
jgi:phage tail tape-measure protein